MPSVLLSLFASDPAFPEIAGDLSEEFHNRRRECGATAARRWYLRESLRNVWILTGREFLRTPSQLIAVAASCGLTLTLLPFLALFEVQHPPYLMEWRTFVLALCAYEMLAPVLVGIVGSRILPGREWALALIFTSVHTLAGMPRLLGDALFDVILPEALSWMSLWTITTFGAACLVMRRSQGGSPQLSLRRRG